MNTEELVREVQTLQASIVDAAGGGDGSFDSSLDDLKVLVRLTVEFSDYLRRAGHGEATDAAYESASTISGLRSFSDVNHNYMVLVGAMDSTFDWATISPHSAKILFLEHFDRLTEPVDFIVRCRLLLDLFRLQMVIAVASYE